MGLPMATRLANGLAARDVWCGPDGLLAACPAGCTGVDMSTTGPAAAREIAAEAARHGADFLDAPVSGSTVLAEQGMLTTMAGGPAEAFERVHPVLAAFTARRAGGGDPAVRPRAAALRRPDRAE